MDKIQEQQSYFEESNNQIYSRRRRSNDDMHIVLQKSIHESGNIVSGKDKKDDEMNMEMANSSSDHRQLLDNLDLNNQNNDDVLSKDQSPNNLDNSQIREDSEDSEDDDHSSQIIKRSQPQYSLLPKNYRKDSNSNLHRSMDHHIKRLPLRFKNDERDQKKLLMKSMVDFNDVKNSDKRQKK